MFKYKEVEQITIQFYIHFGNIWIDLANEITYNNILN